MTQPHCIHCEHYARALREIEATTSPSTAAWQIARTALTTHSTPSPHIATCARIAATPVAQSHGYLLTAVQTDIRELARILHDLLQEQQHDH